MRERLAALRDDLHESRTVLYLQPERVHRVVATALALARQPPLNSTVGSEKLVEQWRDLMSRHAAVSCAVGHAVLAALAGLVAGACAGYRTSRSRVSHMPAAPSTTQ